MKKYAIIGLGNFGLNIARSLMENGCEVLGIDLMKETVDKAKDYLTHAIVANPSNKSILESMGISDYDGVIVSIGQEMASSILISLYLKELNAKKIIVRAISEDHEKILEKLGVDDVIFPEKDMAIRIGKTISMKNALDYLPLTDEYSIIEMPPPAEFIGKSLRELNIAAKYKCQVIGMKYNLNQGDGESEEVKTIIAPSADEVIEKNYILIILGKLKFLNALEKIQ